MSDTVLWLMNNALYFLIACGGVFAFIWLRQFNDRLNMHWAATLCTVLAGIAIGAVCVKGFAALELWDITGFKRMSLFGGVFFMPVFIFLFAKVFKKDTKTVFDITTECLVFMLMCGRINCIIMGCCYGVPFFGNADFLWPVRELEIAFYLVMLFVLGNKIKKRDTYGQIYPIFMIAYGLFRFAVEWARYSELSGIIHRGHVWSALCLIIGIISYVAVRKRALAGSLFQ